MGKAHTPARRTKGRNMPDMDDLKNLAEKHDDKLDKGLEQAGDAASSRFGHEEQIESAVKKGQGLVGDEHPVDDDARQ